MTDIQIYKEPIFDEKTGYLISGVHLMTIDDLLNHEILGGTSQRKKLIYSLKEACETYWYYGIYEIYANGSFATMNDNPNDIDGYINANETDKGLLKLIASKSIWGKFEGKNSPKDKYPMWYEHNIEFYIELNDELFFYNFFTHSREGIKRGIIKVIQGGKND